MHQLHIESETSSGSEVLHLAGAIDSSSFPGLATILNALLGRATPQVVLECARINYIGSSELKELLDLAHIARAQGGDIKCVRLAPTIEQVAALISNGEPLDCFPTVRDALATFHSAPVTA